MLGFVFVLHVDILGSPFTINGDEFENIELTTANADDDVGFTDNGQQLGTTNQTLTTTSGNQPTGTIQTTQNRRPMLLEQSQNRTDINSNVNMQQPQQQDRTNSVVMRQASNPADLNIRQDSSSGYGSEGGGDMLRDMVKNKEGIRQQKKVLSKYNSVESDVSEGSTLVSSVGGYPPSLPLSESFELISGSGSQSSIGAGIRIKYHDIRCSRSNPEVDVNLAILHRHLQLVMY